VLILKGLRHLTSGASRRKISSMDIHNKISLLYQNEAIHRFGLEEKATKVLLKFLEYWQKDPQKYLTSAEVRRNFRSITSEDVRILLHELEGMRLIVGRIKLAQFRYKFNDDLSKWTSFSKEDIEGLVKLKQFQDEKLRKKFERSKKFIEEFEQKEQVYTKTQKDIQHILETDNRTAMEIHQQEHVAKGVEVKECNVCRFEKGTLVKESDNAMDF